MLDDVRVDEFQAEVVVVSESVYVVLVSSEECVMN